MTIESGRMQGMKKHTAQQLLMMNVKLLDLSFGRSLDVVKSVGGSALWVEDVGGCRRYKKRETVCEGNRQEKFST